MLLPLPHCASLPFREPRLAVSVPQTLKTTPPLAAAAAAPTGAVARFGAGSSEDGAERFFLLSCSRASLVFAASDFLAPPDQGLAACFRDRSLLALGVQLLYHTRRVLSRV